MTMLFIYKLYNKGLSTAFIREHAKLQRWQELFFFLIRVARLKSALIRVLSKSVRGNFFVSYYYFSIRRSLKRDDQGQVLQGAKQPPRRRRAFNAAQMRERRRFFFSLSLSPGC